MRSTRWSAQKLDAAYLALLGIEKPQCEILIMLATKMRISEVRLAPLRRRRSELVHLGEERRCRRSDGFLEAVGQHDHLATEVGQHCLGDVGRLPLLHTCPQRQTDRQGLGVRPWLRQPKKLVVRLRRVAFGVADQKTLVPPENTVVRYSARCRFSAGWMPGAVCSSTGCVSSTGRVSTGRGRGSGTGPAMGTDACRRGRGSGIGLAMGGALVVAEVGTEVVVAGSISAAEGGSASGDGAGGAAVGPGKLGTAMVDDKSIARMNQVIPARQARTSAIIIMAESSRWETLRFKRGLLSSSMSTPKRLPMASDASPFKGRAQAQVLFMPRDARYCQDPAMTARTRQ